MVPKIIPKISICALEVEPPALKNSPTVSMAFHKNKNNDGKVWLSLPMLLYRSTFGDVQ